MQEFKDYTIKLLARLDFVVSNSIILMPRKIGELIRDLEKAASLIVEEKGVIETTFTNLV